jgi:hypothetical protein
LPFQINNSVYRAVFLSRANNLCTVVIISLLEIIIYEGIEFGMDNLYASLILDKVFIWQVFLGLVQVVGRVIGRKKGLLIAYTLVFFWTILNTYDGLLILQLLVHSIIAFYLYKSITNKNFENE